MAEPLKELFNLPFYENLAFEFNKVDKNFHPKKFIKDVTANMDTLSLNERMRNTSLVLKKHLPYDFKKSVSVMQKVIPNMKTGYTSLVFPDFVGVYGLDDFHTSMEALKYFTQFGSSEFAIREFLKRDFAKSIKQMNKWAEDKNHHVRRLASEGSRARLPWSFKLEEVIKNPNATQSILEKLNSDSELYVKKSVANHLNDISKDNPEWMLNLVGRWNLQDANTAWIVKHACRTLIKKGDKKTLSIFNFEKNVKVSIINLKLSSHRIKIGDSLKFDFDVVSEKNKDQKIVIDFIIYYVKKAGGLNPKVFKLSELLLKPKDVVHISKKHRFENFTTRKHYPGKHRLEIIVNGETMYSDYFDLTL